MSAPAASLRLAQVVVIWAVTAAPWPTRRAIRTLTELNPMSANMANVWKIAPGGQASEWEMCRQLGCIVIGWSRLKDFSVFRDKTALQKALEKTAKGTEDEGKNLTNAANQIWNFVHEVQPFHVVVANNGKRGVVGIGRIKSTYLPQGAPTNPSKHEWLIHARLVDWLITESVEFDDDIFVQDTVKLLKPEQCALIKKTYLKKHPELKEILDGLFPGSPSPSAAGLETAKMKALLEQFGQIILYGPPGTGKTREAKQLALALLDNKRSKAAAMLSDMEVEDNLMKLWATSRYDLVVFHPAYEYEQFVGGIGLTGAVGQQLFFQAKAGAFLRLCREAEKSDLPVVLIIDEINRGNLPKLLGELIYALEYRGHKVRLPFACDGREDLIIPKNLYVIATMNSSDRSIGHIDVAIRRRFGLYPLGPRFEVVRDVWSTVGDESYGVRLASLMTRLNEKLGSGHDPSAAVELGVGHSYFLPAPGSSIDAAKQQVQMKWAYQVQPLLREYAQILNLGAESLQDFLKPLDECVALP